MSEIITCTIESLSDTQYHLLEYYVHSDAPLTCRVPTRPFVPSIEESELQNAVSDDDDNTVPINGDDGTYGDSEGTSYTPLMFALQGTLQQSHLHVWSDINVLLHQISAVESPTEQQTKKVLKTPGYVVAGTAYSLPELHTRSEPESERETVLDDESIIENARNPWTAGHGTKVVRGEPLTFRFRVRWVSGADSLGWLDNKDERAEQALRKWLTKVVLFFSVAGVGALLATYYERAIRQKRGARGWHGDGILGRPFGGLRRRTGSMSGITYGNSGRANGYGGFVRTGTGTTSPGYGYGYGGYGKKE